MAATRERQYRKRLTPNEVEARYLLVVGEKPEDVAKITDIRHGCIRGMHDAMLAREAEPYSIDEAAAMLGESYRVIYNAVVSGELSGRASAGDEYAIRWMDLKAFAERRLKETGQDRTKLLLFTGLKPELAAKRGRMSVSKADRLLEQMYDAGCGPKSKGPYTTAQAAIAIGPRAVRCAYMVGEFLSIKRFGRSYQITRQELIALGSQERRRGRKAK